MTPTDDPLLDRMGVAALFGWKPDTVPQIASRHRRTGGAAPTWPDPDRVYSRGVLRMWRRSRLLAWDDARRNGRDYDPNPPLEGPDEDPLLDLEGVGAELGMARSSVNQLRLLHGPGGKYAHIPFPDPAEVHGRIPLFRRSHVRHFNRLRPGLVGRPRKGGAAGAHTSSAPGTADAAAVPVG